MRNHYYRSVALGLLCQSLIATSSVASTFAQEVQEKFISSGITERTGGYRPIRADMTDNDKGITKKPDGLQQPRYGRIQLQLESWAFILDEPEDAPAKLYIDANRDGDLTNDPAVEWEPQTRNNLKQYSGKAKLQLDSEREGAIGLYRFDPKDPGRAQLKDTLMFYTDFGTEYTMSLDGTPYKTFISGPLAPNMSVPIDRNGDGRTSRNYEVFLLGKPFNITGTTYVLESVNGKLNLSEAKESVPRLPMPPDLRLGKKALEFKATTMDGTEINFPKSFQGKIVMLDFWATWCGPCVAEVPNMKKAYEAHHENGFEILGVSFDQPNAEQVVQKFLSQRELTWPQIYEGKFWDTTIGQQHDVGAIPFVLLVDGDSGEILGTSKELRGAGLSDFIAEQLEKKNAGKKTP